MPFRMFEYHPTRCAEAAPGHSHSIQRWDGMTREDRERVVTRRFGDNFSTQGDTEVRYVSPRDTSK